MVSNVFWDLAYSLGMTPWDSETPPKELIELVESGSIEPCKVLDIGCGTGTSVIYLASKGFKAHGLDISRVAIWKAKRKASRYRVNCSFHLLDFTEQEKIAFYEPGNFDLVIDIGCYHSIPPGDRRFMYKSSLNKVLKVGGRYLLWCFLKNKGQNIGPPGVDKEEIEELFGDYYEIMDKRFLTSSFREMLFYILIRKK